ncbi:DUF3427 domain-containing protein [Nonomuraea jabiensis]|uniref:DUF3427 domain-containing protein n=1 Tax=Nonomuraea jabiensis TaxID=882448 RepID=UPI003D71B1A7
MISNDVVRPRWKDLLGKLQDQRDISLQQFLKANGISIEELYRRRGGWTALRREVGHIGPAPDPAIDAQLGRAFGRMLHIDDDLRLRFLATLMEGQRPTGLRAERLLGMLDAALWGGAESVTSAAMRLARINSDRAAELKDLAQILRDRGREAGMSVDPVVPLSLHARYTKNEVLAAFGVDKPAHMREGVKHVPHHKADLFFVTMIKNEGQYSESTRYQDYAIDEHLFHWESQSTLRPGAATAIRYISGKSTVHLFLRRSKNDEGFGAPPYTYAGPMRYVSHEGERPIRFVWKLEHPLPPDVHQYASIAG